MLALVFFITSAVALPPLYFPLQWKTLGNDWAGQLIFTQDPNSGNMTGVLQNDNAQIPNGIPNPVEQLDQLEFVQQHNGWYVKFHRPGPDQYYYGLIDDNLENINGQFSHPGYALAFAFDATRGLSTTGKGTANQPPSWSQRWNILANGYPGQLWFTSGSSGSIQFDNSPLPSGTPNPFETITNVTFSYHYNHWSVSFYRPGPNQWYYGIFDAHFRNIHGHFTQGANYPIYPFDATLSGSSCGVPAGTWTVLANSWAGGLEVTSSGAGYLAMNNLGNLNPSAVTNPVETLQSVSILQKYNGYYLNFFRPGSQQWYHGLLEVDGRNMHGSFTSAGNTYEFDATRTVSSGSL